MYYIHTMAAILHHLQLTTYFKQFIRPNDSIINVCNYRHSQRFNAENSSCHNNRRTVKNDKLRDNISKSITLASPYGIAKLLNYCLINSIDQCIVHEAIRCEFFIQSTILSLLSHICFVWYEHTYHITQSTPSYVPVN